MAQCIYAPNRNKFAYGEVVYNRIKQFWGDKAPSRAKFTNVIRNLGVDDTRMVNVRDEAGNRFFGANIKNIDDINFEKAPVPKDTVVRVPTKNGDRFFVANKATETEPQKWMRDSANGQIRVHPDWDAINPNVTEMKRYVREDDGFWRPAKQGEQGSFLNVQNPTAVDRPRSEIIDKGYDAIVDNGRYKLIDESSQAINPKRITDKPNRASLETKVTKEQPTTTEIAEKLKQYDVPQRVAYSIAGGIAGTMADEDGEFAGTFWGGALGLALGSPKVRGKIRGKFNRSGGQGKDMYDEFAIRVTKEEKLMDRLELAKRRGFKGDPADDDAVDSYLREIERLETKKRNGESIWTDLFNNSIFRSGIGLLSGMSPTAKKLLNVLRADMESAPRRMYAEFADIQNRIFGVDNPKEAFREAQINFIRKFDGKLSEDQALQSFGAAVYRLRTFGGRLNEDGTFTYNSSVAANKYYSDDIVRDIDSQLLRDPQALKAYQAIEQFFDKQYQRAVGSIGEQLTKEINSIGDPMANALLREIRSSGLTFKQWKKANTERAKQIKLLEQGKYGASDFTKQHKADVARIKSMIEDEIRFKELEGRYVPQKFSDVKEAAERRKWEQRNASDLQDMTPEQVKSQWERYKASKILELNNDKWKAYELSEDGLDVNTQYFDSVKKAETRLRELANEMDETRRSLVITDLDSDTFRIRDYLDTKVLSSGKKVYSLTTPQKFREAFDDGLYSGLNRDVMDKANRAFTQINITKEADFFDRPRNAEIPIEFKELDLEQLVKFYSDDMGVRLSAIENGMYDTNAVQKNWIQPIREEMAPRMDAEKLTKKTDEIKSWIALMQNQRPERKVGLSEADRAKIARDAETKARNDNLLNSAAKIATAPFNYGTTLYSMFTPAVLGPFIGSWKSIMGEYKNLIYAPDELKAFTREIEKMGVIQKKFESYAPEYRDQYKETLLGDPTSWRRKFSDFADNTTNFTANLSIARMMGIDPERLGIGRLLVGNMLDISGAEAGLTTMAVFRHIEDLLDGVKKLKKNPDTGNFLDNQSVRVGKTDYSPATLRREFERYGITDMEGFSKRSDQFNKVHQFMRGKGSVDDFTPEHYAEVASIVNTIVDQYHARTKLSRPLKWMDNVWGRALSRYSVYAQNFGVQTTGQRIYRPMKDWSDKYSMEDESVPLFKLAYWASTGNDAKLKEVFEDNWEQAYNDFPVDAVNNFFKVFGALAVGKAMMITRGGMLDLTGIATNEAVGNDDYEAWRNVNKQMVLGKDAETGEDFTFEDVFGGDVGGFDLVKMFTSSLAGASRLGFGGRYTQIFTEDLKFTGGGIAEMTPVTGFPNDVFERAGGLLHQTDTKDLPDAIARETLDFMLLRSSPFGTYFDSRQAIMNVVFQKPKNRGIQYKEAGTGISLDVSAYGF